MSIVALAMITGLGLGIFLGYVLTSTRFIGKMWDKGYKTWSEVPRKEEKT